MKSGKDTDIRRYSPIVLALDTDDLEEARRISGSLGEYVDVVKVGLQLFSAAGPEAVNVLKKDGFEVFLDIKMSDIPNTVVSALVVLAEAEPLMMTLHTMGGQEMMRLAASGVREYCRERDLRRPRLIGVTVLTSIDLLALEKIGVAKSVEEEVLKLARLARESGMDGLVTSALETRLVRGEVGPEMLLVTPGIRIPGEHRGDQKRVASPGEAVKSGADFLVIGRTLMNSEDPGKTARDILEDIRNA